MHPARYLVVIGVERARAVREMYLFVTGTLQHGRYLFGAVAIAVGRQHQHDEVVAHPRRRADLAHAVAVHRVEDRAAESP